MNFSESLAWDLVHNHKAGNTVFTGSGIFQLCEWIHSEKIKFSTIYLYFFIAITNMDWTFGISMFASDTETSLLTPKIAFEVLDVENTHHAPAT